MSGATSKTSESGQTKPLPDEFKSGVVQSMRRGGTPLSTDTPPGHKSDEPGKNTQARLHEGPSVDRLTASVGSVAFSVDNHVFLGRAANHLPGTSRAEVLRHEIAHVEQYRQGRVEGVVQRFEGGEHMELGDAGYEAAIERMVDKRLEQTAKGLKGPALAAERERVRGEVVAMFGGGMRRADGQEMSYGLGVGVGGDHYGTVEDMLNDRNKPWYQDSLGARVLPSPQQVDLGTIEKLFKIEQKGMAAGKVGENYDHDDVGQIAASKEYLSLAADNTNHFVGHNLKTYVEHHNMALKLATQAHHEKDPRKKSQLWEQAKMTNAFADHFLTDMFSSGHMRVPRKELTEDMASLDFGSADAGFMAKVLHDYDNVQGLNVKNSRGDSWRAYGDKLLHAEADPKRREKYQVKDKSGKNTGATGRDIAVEATSRSVEAIMLAYSTGEAPKQNAALELVPFIDTSGSNKRLVDEFNNRMPDDKRTGYTDALGLAPSTFVVGEDEMDVLVRGLGNTMQDFDTNLTDNLAKGEYGPIPAPLAEGLGKLGGHELRSLGRERNLHDILSFYEIFRKEAFINADEEKEMIKLVRANPTVWRVIRSADTSFFLKVHRRVSTETWLQLNRLAGPVGD